jgi:hypothetical protein
MFGPGDSGPDPPEGLGDVNDLPAPTRVADARNHAPPARAVVMEPRATTLASVRAMPEVIALPEGQGRGWCPPPRTRGCKAVKTARALWLMWHSQGVLTPGV